MLHNLLLLGTWRPGPFGIMVLCVHPGVNLTIIFWAASDDAHIACIRSCLPPLTAEGLDCHQLCYLEVSKSAQLLEGVDTVSAPVAHKTREPYSALHSMTFSIAY